MSHFQQGIGVWPLLRVDLERLSEVVFEDIREGLGVIDGRCAIRGDEVECLKRVLVEIWWFTFNHLCRIGGVWRYAGTRGQQIRVRDRNRNREDEENTSVFSFLKGTNRDVPIAMIPKLQMSTLGPYSLRVTTSGAIQYGVPTIVVRLALVGSEIWAQKPKSAAEHAVSI